MAGHGSPFRITERNCVEGHRHRGQAVLVEAGGSWVIQPQKPGGDFDEFMALNTANFTYQGKSVPWAATVASGVLGADARFAYTGPASLPQAATAFINNVVMTKEYFAGSKLAMLSKSALTVDGSPAYLVRFTVSYKYAGLPSTQDTESHGRPDRRPGLGAELAPRDPLTARIG